ncbi:serine hydrolase family protein [Aggregatibacter actinomycetemcomitans]|nr:serine hydrolase family protein [Aggregatibacter actinomycetemcomitans]
MNRRQFCYLGLGAGVIVSGMAFGQNLSAMQKYKVFIIHGYGATPQDHWFPWLERLASQYGISVVTIPLPNSEYPDFERWQQTLRDYIGMPDEHCIFVAHSLGTISLLHYLSAMQPKRIGGMILVAGFAGRIPGLATINDFNIDAYVDRTTIDFATIRSMTPKIYCVISDNDYIVTPQTSHLLAQQLQAQIMNVENGGHFLAADGFTKLPQAWLALKQCIQ